MEMYVYVFGQALDGVMISRRYWSLCNITTQKISIIS